eukprot:jgi/Mesvir1/29702/Mv00935-RA.1
MSIQEKSSAANALPQLALTMTEQGRDCEGVSHQSQPLLVHLNSAITSLQRLAGFRPPSRRSRETTRMRAARSQSLLPRSDSNMIKAVSAGAAPRPIAHLEHFVAGLSASFATKLLLQPFDTAKTVMQGTRASMAGGANMAACMRHIVATRGVPGLYTGLLGSMATSAPSTGVFVTVYETVKAALTKAAPATTPFAPMVAALVGNMVASVVRVPPEVVKQRVQMGLYPNMVAACGTMWQQGGVRAFYLGYWAQLIRDIPYSALQFATFEALKARTADADARIKAATAAEARNKVAAAVAAFSTDASNNAEPAAPLSVEARNAAAAGSAEASTMATDARAAGLATGGISRAMAAGKQGPASSRERQQEGVGAIGLMGPVGAERAERGKAAPKPALALDGHDREAMALAGNSAVGSAKDSAVSSAVLAQVAAASIATAAGNEADGNMRAWQDKGRVAPSREREADANAGPEFENVAVKLARLGTCDGAVEGQHPVPSNGGKGGENPGIPGGRGKGGMDAQGSGCPLGQERHPSSQMFQEGGGPLAGAQGHERAPAAAHTGTGDKGGGNVAAAVRPKWQTNLINGAIAGAVASSLTNPLDVVKTRLMTHAGAAAGVGSVGAGGSIQGTVRTLLANEGYTVFLRGIAPRLLYKVPASAVFLVIYEAVKLMLRNATEARHLAERQRGQQAALFIASSSRSHAARKSTAFRAST